MGKMKYEKYIVTELKAPEWRVNLRKGKPKIGDLTLWLDDDVVKGACHVECTWMWPGVNLINHGAHTHEYDEIVGFFGSKQEDTHDLCGEIEWWLGDEKYILTKSCMIFVPKGLQHAPLIVHRVDKPIFHFTIMHTPRYASKMVNPK